MPNPEIYVDIHYHNHATRGDYESSIRLRESKEDDYMLVLPEIPDGSVVEDLQLMSDGDSKLRSTYIQKYESAVNDDIPTNYIAANISRLRGVIDLVFDTGLIVVSVHPHESTALATTKNGKALGKNIPNPATLGEAIEAFASDIPLTAQIITERDEFTSKNFKQRIHESLRKHNVLKEMSDVGCLMEIGSLHFQLTDMLQSRGIQVFASGNHTPEQQDGHMNRAIAQQLTTGSLSEIDLARVAIEDLLKGVIFSSHTAHRTVQINRMIDRLPANEWESYYAEVRKQQIRNMPLNRFISF